MSVIIRRMPSQKLQTTPSIEVSQVPQASEEVRANSTLLKIV